MSKVSSKLAAGVRKVKQTAAPVAEKLTSPETAGTKQSVKHAAPKTELHPSRVWPD